MSLKNFANYRDMTRYLKRHFPPHLYRISNDDKVFLPFSVINGWYTRARPTHQLHYQGGSKSEDVDVDVDKDKDKDKVDEWEGEKLEEINYTCLNDPKKYEEMADYVDSRLVAKSSAKASRGEVFTPLSAITGSQDAQNYLDPDSDKFLGGMLDYLPYSVWSNPNLKWLDPANGIGNFSICVYYRLMDGLSEIIPDRDDRSLHIITKMLFMVELDPENVRASQSIFCLQIDGVRHQANIHEGSFLEADLISEINSQLPPDRHWPEKFDIVMGNPPYNSGGCRVCSSSQKGKPRNVTLWPLFIQSSLRLLKPDGHLTFVTPLSWLRITHPLHRVMLEKTLVWIEIWDNFQARTMFSGSASIPCSLFVLQNTENTSQQTTLIRSIIRTQRLDQTYQVYLDPNKNTPLAYYHIFSKLENLLASQPELQLSSKVLRKTVPGEGDPIALPDHYTAEDDYGVTTYLIRDDIGVVVDTMTKRHPDTEKTKIILAHKTSTQGSFIDDGRLGLIGNNKYYILDGSHRVSEDRDTVLMALSKTELQAMARKNKLKIKGTKAELIERLKQAEPKGDASRVAKVEEREDGERTGLTSLQQLFNTKLATLVGIATKYGQNFLDFTVFSYLPDVRNIPRKTLSVIDDSHLARLLGLSKSEYHLIVETEEMEDTEDTRGDYEFIEGESPTQEVICHRSRRGMVECQERPVLTEISVSDITDLKTTRNYLELH